MNFNKLGGYLIGLIIFCGANPVDDNYPELHLTTAIEIQFGI